MHKLRRRIEVLEKYMSVRRGSVTAAETFVRLARDPASGEWVVSAGCGHMPAIVLHSGTSADTELTTNAPPRIINSSLNG
jgi:hypothetical protein